MLAVAGLTWLLGDRLSLAKLAEHEQALRAYQDEHPVLFAAMAFFLYVLVIGLSLPGAAGMTLLYGWFFGLVQGVVVVSFASTAGATIAFLICCGISCSGGLATG
jgi:uncharacterized membrane protein YdjX (TVP38/TMEM64 family)